MLLFWLLSCVLRSVSVFHYCNIFTLHAVAYGENVPVQAEFGKDKLRDKKDALKKLYDTSKQKLRAMTSKVETSTKVVEKDKAERSEMEIEARKIKLYNSFGKQVNPLYCIK